MVVGSIYETAERDRAANIPSLTTLTASSGFVRKLAQFFHFHNAPLDVPVGVASSPLTLLLSSSIRRAISVFPNLPQNDVRISEELVLLSLSHVDEFERVFEDPDFAWFVSFEQKEGNWARYFRKLKSAFHNLAELLIRARQFGYLFPVHQGPSIKGLIYDLLHVEGITLARDRESLGCLSGVGSLRSQSWRTCWTSSYSSFCTFCTPLWRTFYVCPQLGPLHVFATPA